ncbi:hypothetical protein ON010_g3818 [Phytophthora cinnamomi]|nr:hypothetical protein ON010_g3818 [Phytophthora cinnamomi]
MDRRPAAPANRPEDSQKRKDDETRVRYLLGVQQSLREAEDRARQAERKEAEEAEASCIRAEYESELRMMSTPQFIRSHTMGDSRIWSSPSQFLGLTLRHRCLVRELRPPHFCSEQVHINISDVTPYILQHT